MAWSDAVHFVDLVRVVAKDGSVWWVKPASVPYYAALTSVKVAKA